MEASEKPQLPLDADAPEGSVRAIDDRLVIEALTINDERSARVVRERANAGQEPARTVSDAIEIGSRVLDREDTAAEVEFVKHEFERKAGDLGKQLGETIDTAGEGINESLDSVSEGIVEQLASHFDPERRSAIQNQIRESLGQFGQEQLRAIARIFSAEDGANPLTDFKQSMVRAVNDVATRQQAENEAQRSRIEALTKEIVRLREQDEADRRVGEAEDAGTRKGRSFEERVHEAIERIAAARGDAASHTGAAHAEGGGKKGDTMAELGAADGPPSGRVVFEAKDKKLSKNDAWRELNEAMGARAASFGVLVVAGEERVPAGRETLTEYEGNKLIVAVDRDEPEGLALEVAYRLASARVAMARDRDLTVDAAAVRDAAEEAVSCLKQAQAVRASLTGIKTSSDKARATLDEMVEAVRARIERVESLVEVSEPE
ncbi:MAG: hypothetical protein ACXWEA_05285 [Solirubrobacterales bacterium]